MSTRATYQFNGGEYRPTITLYIHHDGYKEGAAAYFYRAFIAGNGHISAESMIRGNDRAEITESHDAHGDTEYRYTLNGDTLTVEERQQLIEFGSYPKGWRTIYTDDWTNFVNRYVPADWFDDKPEEIRRVDIGYHKGQAMTPTMLQSKLNDKLQTLGQWTVGAYANSPDAANMKSLKAEIAAIQALINKFGTATWRTAA